MAGDIELWSLGIPQIELLLKAILPKADRAFPTCFF
ncbi:uncharacterized protein METZ01_LOCUS147501, partial [marine metagenome]